MKEFNEVYVCVDCLFMLANGELLEDGNFNPDDMDDTVNWAVGDGEHDEEFSSQDCECCGSRLGGSRHQAYWQEKG